jgi:hypothetical protein
MSFDKEMYEVDFYEGSGWIACLVKIGETSSCKVFETMKEAKAYCEKMNKAINWKKPELSEETKRLYDLMTA